MPRFLRIPLFVVLVTIPASASAELVWKEVHGTRVPVPPAHRPRLFLTPAHLPALKARLDHPQLVPVIERIRRMTGRRPEFQQELNAVDFLVNGDRELGRETIARTLELLRQCELPERHDACRVTGRMMVTGAIVYDWLHPLLTAGEKQAYIRELIRLAGTMECGYPPTRQGSITGHASEAQIMRDMLSAGIAIHDEAPEMYDHAAGRFFREHLPARNWLYDGHAHHQGDSYGPVRFFWECFPLWIFDRLGAGNVYNPAQAQLPYRWVYTTRPDGQRLRAGDTFMHSADRGKPWGSLGGEMLAASYYGDGRLLGHYLSHGSNGPNELIFEFLWRDVETEPQPVTDLPLTRYFGHPYGWMVARTGWDEDSVIAEMKVNEYNFNNHQHLDAGAFQIYHKGALAIDSGVYSGSSGAYGSPHCCNYYWRTIAHNSLLIHDPDEEFRPEKGYGNDGGQRLPNRRSEPATLDVLLDPAKGYRTGRVLAHGFGPDPKTPDYSLLSGDITAAYSDKVRQVLRSFVFLNLHDPQTPAAMIVFDRIISREPGFTKHWLLHTLEEPRSSDTAIIIDRSEHGDRGRLVLNPLLPLNEDRITATIGGPGKEYRVFGTNFANDQDPKKLERSSMELGSWRIEISPRSASTENHFLNVMQITDQANDKPLAVEHIDSDAMTGCRIAGSDLDWLVMFPKKAGRLAGPVRVALPANRPCRVLVTGLEAGTWSTHGTSGKNRSIDVTDDSGAAWLPQATGELRLVRSEN